MAIDMDVKEFPVSENLPATHYREIGRIITKWAMLEWRLKNIAYLLLGISAKEGRVAIRVYPATAYVEMLRDLIIIKGLDISFDFSDYKALVTLLMEHRNRLAHGIWVDDPSESSPVLQILSGEWNPGPPNRSNTLKAKIYPLAVLVTLTELRRFIPEIEKASIGAFALEAEVDEALKKLRESPIK